jgi:hypothetical protein
MKFQLALNLRDESIDAHYSGANAEWIDLMVTLAQSMRASGVEFTSDILWKEAEHSGIPAPSEPRALGAVMIRLARLKIAKPTDRTVCSTRPSNHARPIRIWRWV